MKKLVTWVAVLAPCVFSAGTAQAQLFGAQVSWGEDSDVGIGARAEFDFANKLTRTGAFSKSFVIGQFDYYFIDCPAGASCTYWELNPSLAVPFRGSNVKPYAGAGLHVSHRSGSAGGLSRSDTGMGLNLLGGLRFGLGGLDAFSEARLGLGGDYEQFAVSFGFLLGGPRKQ